MSYPDYENKFSVFFWNILKKWCIWSIKFVFTPKIATYFYTYQALCTIKQVSRVAPGSASRDRHPRQHQYCPDRKLRRRDFSQRSASAEDVNRCPHLVHSLQNCKYRKQRKKNTQKEKKQCVFDRKVHEQIQFLFALDKGAGVVPNFLNLSIASHYKNKIKVWFARLRATMQACGFKEQTIGTYNLTCHEIFLWSDYL